MNSKLKTKTHMIENRSLEIVREALPSYWTIRDYKPDYGLDLGIEVFESVSGENYETLGEHFFIQVKGTEKLIKTIKKISSEYNVEKKTLHKKDKEKSKEIEVIKFQIETSELYTIERMSSSIPVFLFVIDVIESKIYFICLNDYIDKIITPHEPNYMNKKTKVIYIPTSNIIDDKGIEILKFYAKRPKLYSFFIKAAYQNNELDCINDEKLYDTYPYFIDRLLRYDIWSVRNIWPLMNMYYEKLLMLKNEGSLPEVKNMKSREGKWITQYSQKEFSFKEASLFMNVRILWRELAAISNVYDEDCREWFLPTYFNILISVK